jgi:hypothetical protein
MTTIRKDAKPVECLTKKLVLEETVYACPVADCGKLFKSRYALKRHSSVHHKDKPYRCTVCGKYFALPQYLRDHANTHTGAEPYLCGIDDCPRRFRQAGKLSIHRRTHKGYKAKHYNFELNPKLKRGDPVPPSSPLPRPQHSPSNLNAPLTMQDNTKDGELYAVKAHASNKDCVPREQGVVNDLKMKVIPAVALPCSWPMPRVMQSNMETIFTLPLKAEVDENKTPSHGELSQKRKTPRAEVPMLQCLPWLELPFPIYVSPILPVPNNESWTGTTRLPAISPIP